MYAVVVTLQIVPADVPAFLTLVKTNAATSLRDEPDCHQFDVCTSQTSPSDVFLYEVYSNRAGFDAHLASPHFKTFDTATSDMIVAKDIRLFETVVR